MNLKQKVHHYYLQQVQDKIDVFRDMIVALTEDAKNDAKGSAGDKHETALSMMHIEQEKLNHKLKEVIDQKAILDKIDPTVVSNKIANSSGEGSLSNSCSNLENALLILLKDPTWFKGNLTILDCSAMACKID